MTKLYNRKIDTSKRKMLRNNMPEPEKRLWLYLRRRQVLNCKFRRQYGVGKFVIDFYCPAIKLAIEVDGDSHAQVGIKEYDKERQEYIESAGITFLRFTNKEVIKETEAVLEKIQSYCESKLP